MSVTAIQNFIENEEARLAPLLKEYNLAEWASSTTGSDEAADRAAKLRQAWMTIFADRDAYHQVKAWYETARPSDLRLARRLKIAYLAYKGGQRDAETIQALTELQKRVQQSYVNFRAMLDGQALSDNELENLLQTETDSRRLQAAWEASKQVGTQVADQVRELAEWRNRGARLLGYRDYYEQSLDLEEIGEDRLFEILDELETLTTEPFRRVKAELDARLSERFGLPVTDLRPWHYGNPFFQAPPEAGTVQLDHLFQGQNLEALATKTFDGVGLAVRDILARSDLYARPGKDQHAFCMDVDRAGDIRMLCNLETNHRWTETLLHELGHGVYDKYIPPTLPWGLRVYPHLMNTEASAMLFGRLALNPAWLTEVLGAPGDEVTRLAPALRERQRLAMLIFTRWVLVMAHFERALYADPRRDLDTLWWNLVERFQMLTRPAGRQAPDWAAKYHVAMAPVYYHNYLLGELIVSQLQHAIQAAGIRSVNDPRLGRFLVDHYYHHGAEVDWDATVERATGERLSPLYFVHEFVV